jgi:hypothetical protein
MANVAQSERLRKEGRPELYCPVRGCLWMTGDGRKCPKHGGPSFTPQWRDLANRISRGDITVEEAHEILRTQPNRKE